MFSVQPVYFLYDERSHPSFRYLEFLPYTHFDYLSKVLYTRIGVSNLNLDEKKKKFEQEFL